MDLSITDVLSTQFEPVVHLHAYDPPFGLLGSPKTRMLLTGVRMGSAGLLGVAGAPPCAPLPSPKPFSLPPSLQSAPAVMEALHLFAIRDTVQEMA